VGAILVATLAFNIQLTFSWLYWLLACIFLGACAFGVNELIDANDTDKHSWNIHHADALAITSITFYFLIALAFILGMFFSYIANQIWWGSALVVVSLCYSVKPIRGKARFGLDILFQLVAAWLIPSWALIWNHSSINAFFWELTMQPQVDKTLREKGTYIDVVFDDPIIHRVIHDMGGWVKFGEKNEDEWPFVAKEFQTRYQSFKSRNEIPDHPGVLVGIANAHNRREGHELEPYLMIGNVEKCKAIVEKKDSKPMIQFTKAAHALDSFTKQLAAYK
jgi:hypothetical protein